MLTLRWKQATPVPVEAECIRPDQLAGKSRAEIAQLIVQHGNRQERLGEFFDIHGAAEDGELTLEGEMGRVKWVGTGMTRGRITIHGNIGMHLGSEMAGGRIEVHGNAGDWVGAEMRGGLIQVFGNALHQVGAAYRGSRRGMRGGTILIHGSAGNEIGSTMRRGLIAIGGDSADFAGVSMIAGSILLFGSTGIRIGAGMKRGTIALCGPSAGNAQLLPTFRLDCRYRPLFMSVFLRALRQLGFPVPESAIGGMFQRYSGDLIALGKGEILVWHSAGSHPA
jgi:formylmethanofuran dehydrogenase subunit C